MFSKQDVEKYFIAEKTAGLLFLIIGIIAIILAIVFYSYLKANFHKGAAIPLLAIGLLQAFVGYTVYTRSDQQRISNVYAYDMNPDNFKKEELPRMKTVNRNIAIFCWAEIILLAAGAVLTFLYRANPDKTFWYGLGITLLIQAALMLVADILAGQRARRYTEQIEIFVNKNKAI
jgi:magnesium-transporting ATPase (P-type)